MVEMKNRRLFLLQQKTKSSGNANTIALNSISTYYESSEPSLNQDGNKLIHKTPIMKSTTQYEQKPLPFQTELKGISNKTINIHHDKLYAGYVSKMNEITMELNKIATGEKEAVGNQTYSELRGLRSAEIFATNGVYLHEAYFNTLNGDGSVPDNSLTRALIEKFGSMEQFFKYFSASGMSMRGWVVLAWDIQLERLKIYGCDSHDQGGVWGCIPILVLDVYEHAYFLDYESDRSTYIADFWKNIDWNFANTIFEKFQSIHL